MRKQAYKERAAQYLENTDRLLFLLYSILFMKDAINRLQTLLVLSMCRHGHHGI